MKPLSLRWKIGLWSASLAVITLVIFCAATFLNLYQEQLEAADMDCLTVAGNLAGTNSPADSLAELRQVQPWIYLAVFDQEGLLKASSLGMPEDLARLPLNNTAPSTVEYAGRAWRIAAYSYSDRTLSVAYDLAEIHDIVSDLALAYLLSLPLVMILSAGGGWWLSGKVLAPIQALTEEANAITAKNLSIRIKEPEPADDIQKLAIVLNSMLARLERSFLQAERFAADASHELRTPLTIIRGELEVLLRSPNLTQDQIARLLSVQEETHRLSGLTESLLLLARLDAGISTPAPTPLDFSALCLEQCEDGSLLADLRGLSFSHSIDPDLRVNGDAHQLRRVIINLLDNASRHNQTAGSIHCELHRFDAEQLKLSVSNTGPLIPEALQPRLFERFFRADEARESGGFGLGLSLAYEIAIAHGGSLTLARSDALITEFVLTLPRADSQSAKAKLASAKH